jgi:hypothetical protein
MMFASGENWINLFGKRYKMMRKQLKSKKALQVRLIRGGFAYPPLAKLVGPSFVLGR